LAQQDRETLARDLMLKRVEAFMANVEREL
jgi:hypothetical protein